MKKYIVVVLSSLFLLVACSGKEIVSQEEYGILQEENNELQKELDVVNKELENLQNQLESSKETPYYEAGISPKTFIKPSNQEENFYGELSETEFNYRMSNTISWLENDFDFYRTIFEEMVDTYLDKKDEDFKDDIDFDILHKESLLLHFDLVNTCAGMFTSETMAHNLEDSLFMKEVFSSCNNLSNAFRFISQYDTGLVAFTDKSTAEMVEEFYSDSIKSHRDALEFYKNELE